MNLRIVDQTQNALLKRTELRAEIEHPGAPTPKLTDIRAELAGQLKLEQDLVIIDRVLPTVGKTVSRVSAYLFKAKEDIPKDLWKKSQIRLRLMQREPKKKKSAGTKK